MPVPTANALPTKTVSADTATSVPTATVMPTETKTVVSTETATGVPTETVTVTPIKTATAAPMPTEVATAALVPTVIPEVPRENPAIDIEADLVTDPADIFDPAGPTPESVVEEADPASGEVNDSRLTGLIFKTQIYAEGNPEERNETEQIVPGGVAIFVISFENNTSNPLNGVVIRIVIPSNTTFRLAGSVPLPMAQLIAAGADSVAAFDQNRGTEWELADLSGPCPDGAPAGTECIFRLGTVQPGESGELSLPTIVDEDVPDETQLALDSTLVAAILEQGLLVAIGDEANIETAPIIIDDIPTSIDQSGEPFWKRVFLPLISR